MIVSINSYTIVSEIYKDDKWYLNIYVNGDRILPAAEFNLGAWSLYTFELYESFYWKRYKPKDGFFNIIDAEKAIMKYIEENFNAPRC